MGSGWRRFAAGLGAAMEGGADTYTRLKRYQEQKKLMEEKAKEEEAQRQINLLEKQLQWRKEGQDYGPIQIPSMVTALYPELGTTTRKFPLQGEFQGRGSLDISPTEITKETPRFVNILPKKEKSLEEKAEEERTLTEAREQGKLNAIPPEEREYNRKLKAANLKYKDTQTKAAEMLAKIREKKLRGEDTKKDIGVGLKRLAKELLQLEKFAILEGQEDNPYFSWRNVPVTTDAINRKVAELLQQSPTEQKNEPTVGDLIK